MLTRYRHNLHIEGNKVFSYDTHVATIERPYLIKHGWWSQTTSKHVNYVASEYGLDIIDNETAKEYGLREEVAKTQKKDSDPLRITSMVAAMGSVLCDNNKDINSWKKRFLSMAPGIDFPEDFDQLPEEEKQRRLDGAIAVGLNKK